MDVTPTIFSNRRGDLLVALFRVLWGFDAGDVDVTPTIFSNRRGDLLVALFRVLWGFDAGDVDVTPTEINTPIDYSI